MHKPESSPKINRPDTKSVYLREHFFKVLDRCRKKPVIWVSGMPGAGKTTLIGSYIGNRKAACLWYQADQGDKDPAAFFHYLNIAAANISKGKARLPHYTPEYSLGLQAFSKQYFEELFSALPKGSFLVLDNFQDIPIESATHEAIQCGLSSMPKGVNAVIISRSEPSPFFLRMRLEGLMEAVSWHELRLTSEEVRGVALNHGMGELEDKDVQRLLSCTDGWMAGVVLMLGGQQGVSSKCVDGHDPEATSRYFREGFFDRLGDNVKDTLLMTSVFPSMTKEMANGLAGHKDAGRDISALARRNFFIQSYNAGDVYFRYHPLFRDFLSSRLKRSFSPGELAEIEGRAAVILSQDGQHDEAARLFRKTGKWEALAALIMKEAPAVIRQGRSLTLKGWLDGIGPDVMKRHPWLWFWKGACYFNYDQSESAKCYETAFRRFFAQGDISGIFLSWAGIVDSIVLGFDDMKPLDRWIRVFEKLLKEHGPPPSGEIHARATMCMFLALSFRAPQHKDVKLWADRAHALLQNAPDPDMTAQISLFLIDYYLWTGELEKADILVERLSRVPAEMYSPLGLIAVKLAQSLNNWYRGRLIQCRKTVSEGLETAEGKGVNVFDYFLYGHGAVSSITGGDLSGADAYLNRAASVLDVRKRLCASYYHHLEACLRSLKKDQAGAIEHEKLSLSLALDIGHPFGEAMSRACLSLLHYEIGERQMAAEEAKTAYVLALKTGSRLVEFVCLVFKAYFAVDRGDRSAALKTLREAFVLGRRQGFVNFHMWRPDIMVRLCVLALEEDIEPEYAKRLITGRGLFPAHLPFEVENWPWKVRIYTLGGFDIYKDGVRVEFGKKFPKKPLDMLRLVIAFGNDAAKDRIADALWPDAEGDAAHAAFDITLKRLRVLIGMDEAIVLRDGRVSVNTRHCWVDVWAFRHLFELAESRAFEARGGERVRLLERAVKLCSNGFKGWTYDNHGVAAFLDQTRNRFVRAVARLGGAMEEAGDLEKAAVYYRSGIEAEPLSEELHQKLMACLLRQGCKAEAAALYKRFSKALFDTFGIEPSSVTKDLLVSDNPRKMF